MNNPKNRRGVKPLEPFYAAVGATDLTLERLRSMSGKVVGDPPTVDDAKQAPVRALNQTLDVLARGRSRFGELAERGRAVVRRNRNDVHLPSGMELRHQAEETVAMSRKVAARAAEESRKAAEATLKTVRHEADHLVDDTRKVASATVRTVRHEADVVREAVTRRELPKRPHVPTSLRRRSEANVTAAADEPPAKPAPKSPAKPTAKAAPRPARKSTPRKRTAAATKAAAASGSAGAEDGPADS